MNLRYCELIVNTPYCILQSDDESGSVIQEDLQAVSFGGFYLGVVTKLTYKKSRGLEERRYVAFEVFASYSHPEKIKEERFSQIALIPAHPSVPISIDLPKTINEINF